MEFVKKPWGRYLTLFERKHFKIKLLWFRRGGSCSLQHHNYRSELWLFFCGRGRFWRGGDGDDFGFFDVRSGDSIGVPLGHRHKYRAFTRTLVLEIQYGEKCIEEDIVRA